MTKLQTHLLTAATRIGNLRAGWIRSAAKPSGVAGGVMSNRVRGGTGTCTHTNGKFGVGYYLCCSKRDLSAVQGSAALTTTVNAADFYKKLSLG